MAWKERLLADHLVNDSDAFAKKIDAAEIQLLFGVLRDDKGKHEAALEEDLAEEGILVTNLSI